jgi:hypothetical protein
LRDNLISDHDSIRLIIKRNSVYAKDSTLIVTVSIIIIFIILLTGQTAPAFAQVSILPFGTNLGRLILYSIIIIFVIITRIKWTKHGRKVTKPKIMAESSFFITLSSLVIFDSFYNVGVPILFVIPYLILFFGLQHYSYLHSHGLISFWRDSKSGSIYVKGGTHIHLAYVIGTTSRIVISVLFVGSLFSPSKRGVIYLNDTITIFATILTDLLFMISLGLLMGINRRTLIRYKLIMNGKEDIPEK